MQPTFGTSADATCVEIADPIENARFELRAGDPVEPTPADPGAFCFPVDAAVAIETAAVEVPKLANVLVRTRDGDLVVDNADRADRSLPPAAYDVELSTAPMKLYLSVETALEVHTGESSVTVEFDGPTEVRIGARSFHDRPAGTVTTTPDPEGAMAALSYLGSALKTTSPERSFPTLRGHPPLVETGEAFDAPDGVEPPDTGIRLELPAEFEYVYPAAPLAYYLGATAVPGDDPRLVTDSGFAYDLDRPPGYEATAGRVLRQAFLFDCVVRTEGYYRVDLHEREGIEGVVDLDFADLYAAPPAERVASYLSVDYDDVAEYVPDWHLTTDVTPTPDDVAVLPFVADDLALVRCPDGPAASSVDPTPDPLGAFFRRGGDADATDGTDYPTDGGGDAADTADCVIASGGYATDGGVVPSPAVEPARSGPDDPGRSTTDAPAGGSASGDIFTPEPADTVAHAWVGEGFPVGANKASVEAYRRRAERSAPEGTGIDIHVVCNDERMAAEGVVEDLYGLRDLLRFDVTVHHELPTDELADLLTRPADFLHYVGHVDEEGMRCPDGHLDARGLDEVAVTAFLLNACRSYAQGEALIDAGSYGGVVTLSEVANSVATEVGRTLARLLNCGFPLRVALSVVKDTVAPAYQYTSVGDGGLTLCQSESGTPLHLEVRSLDSDRYEVTFRTYPSPSHGLGSMQKPNIGDANTRYIASGAIDTFEMGREELGEFFRLEVLPVELDGELRWSDELAVSEF